MNKKLYVHIYKICKECFYELCLSMHLMAMFITIPVLVLGVCAEQQKGSG